MANEKAMYWLAVGVAALGLNSAVQSHEVQWAQNLADRATVAAERIAERGLDYAVMAETMLGRNPADSPRLQAALARLQAKTACVQAALARQQAMLARLQARRDRTQAQRDRLEAMQVRIDPNYVMNVDERMRFCPRRIHVHVPDVRVDMQPVVDQLQDLSTSQDLQSLKALESLRNLPNASDFDFSSMSEMNMPNGTVKVEILRNKSDANGPI